MFQSTPRWCPCGCDSSYIFECEGVVAPKQGGNLFYTCPRSGDPLAFQSRGHWVLSQQDRKHTVVKVSLKG